VPFRGRAAERRGASTPARSWPWLARARVTDDDAAPLASGTAPG